MRGLHIVVGDEKGKLVEPKDGDRFTLEEMQAFVGGYVEKIYFPDGRGIYLNENGKNEGLPENVTATEIWKKAFPKEQYPDNNDELVVGDVLIISANDEAEMKVRG